MKKPSTLAVATVLASTLFSNGLQAANFIRAPSNVAAPTTVPAATALSSAVVLRMSEAAFDFGKQSFRTDSEPHTFTLSNKGSAPVVIASMGLTGATTHFGLEFADCERTLAPGATCTGTVYYRPQVLGQHSAQVNATLGNSKVVNVASVSGTGVQGVASFNVKSLSFKGTQVGVTSAPAQLVLTNAGSGQLTIKSLTLSGDSAFAMSSACPEVLQAGAKCGIELTFTPPDGGLRNALVTLSVGGSMTPVSRVQVFATPQQIAMVDDSTGAVLTKLNVPSTMVGTTSQPAYFQLKNTGIGSANLGGAATSVGAPFSIASNTCGSSLAVGSTCRVGVVATPTAVGPAAGQVVVPASAGTMTLPVTHTATGPVAELSTYALNFADQHLGTNSAAQRVVLLNKSLGAIWVGQPATGQGFVAATDCGAKLEPGATCNVDVQFSPAVAGDVAANLTIPTQAGNQVVGLTGKGLLTQGTVPSGSLDFGDQEVGTTSAPMAVSLVNTGNTDLSLSNVSVSGPFTAAHNCPSVVPVGASCTVNVAFAPNVKGAAVGALSLATGAGAKSVALTGVALQAALAATTSSDNLGDVQVGVTKTTAPFVVTNSGTTTARGVSVSSTSAFTVVNNTCSPTLALGANCSFALQYTATLGAATGSAAVTSTNAGAVTVTATANGVPASASASSASIDFADVQVGATSAEQIVT